MLINCWHDPQVNESGPIHSIPLVKFNECPHRGHFKSLLVAEERNTRVIDVKLDVVIISLDPSIMDCGLIVFCECSFNNIEPLS